MIFRFLVTSLCATGLLFGLSTQAQAQADPIKFGKVESKDFDAKNFVADSSAEAVILCDFGRSRINYQNGGFQVVFDRITRIKILKKSGYDWATVKIPLYKQDSNTEKVTSLKAVTYNLVNGEIVKDKLESSGMFTEQIDTYNAVRKFTMPNVKEGSVIEYAYTVTSDFIFNFQDWQFQHTIPVRWSEYRASIPEYFEYRIQSFGYEPMVVNENNTSTGQITITWSGKVTPGMSGTREAGGSETLTPRVTNHRWAMQNVPEFRDEPFMTARKDFISHIDFELAGVQMPEQPYRAVMGTWTKINTELMTSDNFGGQLNKTGFLKNEALAAASNHTNPTDQATAIVDLVKRSISFNGHDRLDSREGIRKAYERHSGTSADINLLLVGLLREIGLKANPVIISTRNHGRIDEEMPLISRFNYVLAHIALPDNTELLLDATEALATATMLPERCLNTKGRLITKNSDDSRWVTVNSSQRYVHFQTAQLTLDERGGYSGKIHDEHNGYDGLYMRSKLKEDGEKKFVEENFLKGNDGWEITKFAFEQKEASAKPLALDMEVKVPGNESAASTIYLSPMRYFGETHNPFRLENRQFPVDFGAARDETVLVTINLPAGYEVEELPKNAMVSLPDNGGRFQFSIAPNGSTLQLMSRFSFSKPWYSAEEYANLREFYSMIVAKHAEKIVLKKKS